MPLKRYLIPAASVLCYAALGEVFFHEDRPVRDWWGECVEAPADYGVLAMVFGVAVFVLASGGFALAAGARWKAATMLQAALALMAGGFLGHAWYEMRMERGAECTRMIFCSWCMEWWWERPAVEIGLLAIMGALLSLPVGALARWLLRLWKNR